MIEVSHLVKEFKIPVQKKGRFYRCEKSVLQ